MREISALIYNFTFEIAKYHILQRFVRLSAKMASKFKTVQVVNEDVRHRRHFRINAQKSTPKRNLSGILLKNSKNYEHKSQFKV